MLEELKATVLAANLELPKAGLVTLTWGNASGRDRETGLMVIKPSGVSHDVMTVDDMVVIDSDGQVVEGKRRPSADTPTHLTLYRGLPGIGGIVHTHSTWATAWAQARRPVPILGTTHADFCPSEVPVSGPLSPDDVRSGYEVATGHKIVSTVAGRSPQEVPAVLVDGHGPFCWGLTPADAVVAAITLESVAKMAWLTVALNTAVVSLPEHIVTRHFTRKHGSGAYYGQP